MFALKTFSLNPEDIHNHCIQKTLHTLNATGSDCLLNPDLLLRSAQYDAVSVSRQHCDRRVACAVPHTLLSVDEEGVCFARDVFLQGQSAFFQVRQRFACFIQLLL